MLKETKKSAGIEGRLDADIDVKGSGSSVAEIMATLNGKTVLLMNQGSINNKYAGFLGTGLGSNLFKLLGLSQENREKTPINCLVSGFLIKDGHADTTALVCDIGEMNLIGDGEINLKTEQLNIALSPTFKKGIGSLTTGKVNIGLGQLTRNLRLAGTLARPTVSIDPTQTAATIGKMAGGLALLGSAGHSSGLASTNRETEDLCPAATEAARKGVKMTLSQKTEKGVAESSQKPKESLKDLGKELRKFFGR